jgi:hypothetical protein
LKTTRARSPTSLLILIFSLPHTADWYANASAALQSRVAFALPRAMLFASEASAKSGLRGGGQKERWVPPQPPPPLALALYWYYQ